MVKLLFVICIGLALWLGSMMMGGRGGLSAGMGGGMRGSSGILAPVKNVGGAAIGVLGKFRN